MNNKFMFWNYLNDLKPKSNDHVSYLGKNFN